MLGASCWNINTITAVVFGGSYEIPARNAMKRPGETSVGGFKDKHFGARRRNRRFVKIKITGELGFGREAGVDARETDQV